MPRPPTDDRKDATGVPTWLRSGADIAWRALVVAAAVLAATYALAYLAVVALPIIVALLLSTLLLPPAQALCRRGFPAAAGAATVMVGALLVMVGLFTLIAPAIIDQIGQFGTSLQDGLRTAADVLTRSPFNLSPDDIDMRIKEATGRLGESSGAIGGGALRGAVLLGEVVTGLILTVLLLFFFLKDGEQIWAWVVGLFGAGQRHHVQEIGRRSYTALSGYVRGVALIGVADAVLIGIGLLILGVPLVVPLMVLTFLGAFLPVVGAFAAGLAAVLIALVAKGPVVALIVVGIIVLVQQLEGHIFYPLIMGRTVKLHPVAIILALATGGIVAGVLGIFLAVPVASVASIVLGYARGAHPPQAPAVGGA